MSRQARELSQSGMYHIFFKGICRQNIFEEPADYSKLKDIIKQVKKEMQFELYAYCFMTNHVHLFLKEKNVGEISKIMSKILSHYATWYNIKYTRYGALFSNRYNSQPVEDDRYYLSLIRYIHQNPLKAHIAGKISAYPYSSYNEYVTSTPDITDTYFLLDMLDSNTEKAKMQFLELHEAEEIEDYDLSDSRRKSTAQIRRIIMSEIDGKEPGTIKEMETDSRNELIKKLINEKGISKSALERAIGMSRTTIARICDETQRKASHPQNVPSFLD